MTERAKLYLINSSVALLLLCGALSACVAPARVHAVYAHDTRVLLRLDYDHDGDGIVDVRTYMRDGRPVRLEADADGDGRVDRWEYYAAGGELLRIGASTRRDGREDTWVREAGDERHVWISTRRDHVVDRREVYRAETLLSVESDSNFDGVPDRWEEFQDGVLAQVLLDDELKHGRPTRRLVYEGGREPRVEMVAVGGAQ